MANKEKQIKESKIQFLLRCLDIIAEHFLLISDDDVFCLLDMLADSKATTRCEAGSSLSIIISVTQLLQLFRSGKNQRYRAKNLYFFYMVVSTIKLITLIE